MLLIPLGLTAMAGIEIADLAGSATHFTKTSLHDPASFRYRIRTYNRGSYSAYSNVATPDFSH